MAQAGIKYRAHFIPNSHLDREWTMDFQHTRALTVQFIDGLLEIMEAIPEYEFLLDSQTLPLEDYLEIRPENRSRIEAFVRAGRLHIGPWYSAPDMNTISGESITRNLLWGHKTAERFGRVMKVGYTPFGFVHISQLPQIYAGFGIDTCFFYRGINKKLAPRAEFIWEAPDGTRVLASRMSDQPRYNFYMNVWRKALYADQESRLDRRYDWRTGQLPFRICDTQTRYEHGSILRPRRELRKDVIARELKALFEREKRTFRTGELAFMHGFDSSAPEMLENDVLEIGRHHLAEGEELFYSSLPKYVEALKQALKDVELPVLSGEMKHPDIFDDGFLQSFVNVVSTRPRQKQHTDRVESLLVRTSEPFAAIAHVLGEAWPEEYLGLAWRYFLKTHAHDTIGGCCIDRVEEDAHYHLAQAESLGKLVLKTALGQIQSRIDVSDCSREDILLTLYNPSPFPRTELVTCYVDVPRELGFDSFKILDLAGHERPFVARRTGGRGKVFRDVKDLALFSDSDEYEVLLEAMELPPLGYETFVVRRGRPLWRNGSLVAGASSLENEHVRVELRPDGSLDILNKHTGRRFERLHVFEDVGEAGHPWMHMAPKRDMRITSDGLRADITLLEDTPLRASYAVELTMMIPKTTCYDPERRYRRIGAEDSWREGPLVPLRIRSVVSLARLARSVDIVTTVSNTSRNHRLRLLFPTGLHASHTYAETAYDVVERPIKRDISHPQFGMPHIGQTFLRFVDIHDGKDGLAFIGKGLREYEALDDGRGTLAVTLFRALENWLCTTSVWDLMPGELMQVLGETTYHYRLYPHAGSWEESAILEEAEMLNHPVIPCLAGAEPGGVLPKRHSFFALEGANVFLSCIKKAERSDAIVVRIFNPSRKASRATLHCAWPVRTATFTNMNEEPFGGVATGPAVDGHAVSFDVPPKKVVTVALTFG